MATKTETPATLVPIVVDHTCHHTVESACFALKVLEHYTTITASGNTVPMREMMVNLLADLGHLSEQSGLSFDTIFEEAQQVVQKDLI